MKHVLDGVADGLYKFSNKLLTNWYTKMFGNISKKLNTQ